MIAALPFFIFPVFWGENIENKEVKKKRFKRQKLL
jgi:hypothetical protein